MLQKPEVSAGAVAGVRLCTSLVALAVAAGCAQPAAVANDGPIPPDFAAYIRCDWLERVPGTCDNGVDQSGEFLAVEAAAPPPGWLCFHWISEPDFPFWKMGWSPHRTSDGTGVERWLGFWFDAAPYDGPVEGWFKRFSDMTEPKLYHFSSPVPRGFIEFPDAVEEDEIQYQLSLLPARGAPYDTDRGLEDGYKQAGSWPQARSHYVAEGVAPPWPDGGALVWERIEPLPGWWKVLRPTFAIEVPQGVAYFPIQQSIPYFGDENDPSTLQGSGHWSTATGRTFELNETGPGWHLRVRTVSIAAIDGHQEDFTNPLWQFLCGCPDKQPTDLPDYALCLLGIPPPVVDGRSVTQAVGAQIHPPPPNLQTPSPLLH